MRDEQGNYLHWRNELKKWKTGSITNRILVLKYTIMKTLLIILALFLLTACEKSEDCWLCSVEKGTKVQVWNEWYQRDDEETVWKYDGIETFCNKKPVNKIPRVRYDCEPI